MLTLDEKAVFLEKQLEAYERLAYRIVEFELLPSEDFDEKLIDSLLHITAEFLRCIIFLDNETVRVFDERINAPFKKKEFMILIEEKGYEALYTELRLRLSGEVLSAARAFLKKKFPDSFE